MAEDKEENKKPVENEQTEGQKEENKEVERNTQAVETETEQIENQKDVLPEERKEGNESVASKDSDKEAAEDIKSETTGNGEGSANL